MMKILHGYGVEDHNTRWRCNNVFFIYSSQDNLYIYVIMRTLSPTLLEETESFTGLHGNFSEEQLPKMP
jgi:hypothetical protein